MESSRRSPAWVSAMPLGRNPPKSDPPPPADGDEYELGPGKDDPQIRAWRLKELRELNFSLEQRAVLLELIEKGDVELATIRDLVLKRHWTAEQAFLCVA